MGFYFKLEYELLCIAILIAAIPIALKWMIDKLNDRKMKSSCLNGTHAMRVVTDNYYYTMEKCSCGKKQRMISRT